MSDVRPPNDGPGKDGFAGFIFVALAIGCCAGLPLIAAVAGSVAIGTLLGVGAGLVGLIVLVAIIVLRVRARQRAVAPRPPSSVPAARQRH